MFKKLMAFLFVMIAFTGIFISCSDDDSSTNPSTIPTVSFTAPLDGEEIPSGENYTITASASDNVAVTKVEFYIDSVLVGTDSTSTENPYEYVWSPTGLEGPHKMFLTAYDADGNSGSSAEISVLVVFSGIDVTAPTAWITAPEDSTSVIGGLSLLITADGTDNVGVTKIEFYVDSILEWTDTTPLNYEYLWDTVDKEGEHWIYVKAYDNALNAGSSDPILVTVTRTQQITVNAPNGSESWNRGSVQEIRWTSNTEDSLLQIDLYKGFTFVNTISNMVPNDTISDASYTWTIPEDLPTATDYLIKITGLQTTISDYSNSGFDIVSTPFIQITTPNGGEIWNMDSEYEIQWQDNLAEDVKIELFRASTLELTVSDSTASDGSFMWTLPNTLPVGSNYKIRITSIPVNTVVDNSDASFTISAP
ncbi:TPA: hypothetical protein DCR49_05255 [Candidatus Delongbacteria bacterium]|nr:hypothetical protein [Candidatus Delongbacteria bacterium]